ncbi:MAG: hypothetical protein JNK06_12445 [Candidatus Accumulibacter phosphatis]|uniref:hypothetical protein n=1 Tax=Candidatus Accumulibacter phosphatis TaxID=327160 RepID=UPI001A620CD0|nr:hypothetical protein [Candidatus Accumulibacter phosphatis]
MNDELNSPRTIWVLLAELAKRQFDWDIHDREIGARRIRDEVRRHFNPVPFERLDSAKDSDYSVFPVNSFLHLPPDNKGGWKQPILRASFDVIDGHTVFRVKAAILVENKERNEKGEAIYVHRGIGIRFESQEGPAGKSIHDYAHAQLSCAFDKGSPRLPHCPSWLPDVHPAIPIEAENRVDILCCALKSLYGARSEPLKWLASAVKNRTLCRSLGVETGRRVSRWAGVG